MKNSTKIDGRLRLKSDFDYVRHNGIKHVGKYCLLVVAPANGEFKAGVICSKKYNKRAVVRNRARRLLWESFRLLKIRIKPCQMIMIVRRHIAGQKQQNVQEDLKKLLLKANVLSE